MVLTFPSIETPRRHLQHLSYICFANFRLRCRRFYIVRSEQHESTDVEGTTTPAWFLLSEAKRLSSASSLRLELHNAAFHVIGHTTASTEYLHGAMSLRFCLTKHKCVISLVGNANSRHIIYCTVQSWVPLEKWTTTLPWKKWIWDVPCD